VPIAIRDVRLAARPRFSLTRTDPHLYDEGMVPQGPISPKTHSQKSCAVVNLRDFLPEITWVVIVRLLLRSAEPMLKPPLEEIGEWLRRRVRSMLPGMHSDRGST
jgi:hypothetical protein